MRRIQQIVGQIGRSAGILKKVHPHMLRHTRATLLVESGMTKDVLQQFLGHKSGATTEIYSRTANLQLNQEFQRIAGQYLHI